jgi:allantoinase
VISKEIERGTMDDIVLRNGLLVTEQGAFRGGVAVHSGVITRVFAGDTDHEARITIDLYGKWLLPGLVDAHVHFHEPGREAWEGYETGSMAAAAGGVTTVLEMPLNGTPTTIDRDKLLLKRKVAEGQSLVDYAHWGGLVNNNLSDLASMHDEGVIGFKAFMVTPGTEGFTRVDDDILLEGMRWAKRLGSVIGLHAENERVYRYLRNRLEKQGKTDPGAWMEARASYVELEAVKRAAHWAVVSGGRVHFVHLSTSDSVRATLKARQQGAAVTAETCPHYLLFDSDDFVRRGAELKCAPPLRSRKEVEELWRCVLHGYVDIVASDHAPCTHELKERGRGDIWQAWGGITGIQAMLPALITEGVLGRGLPLPALARMTSGNPARIFGLYPRKGAIIPGADADLVVVDPNSRWTMGSEDLLSKNKHSAYVGYTFRARVVRTFVRGETVFDEGEIRAAPGYGRLIRRQPRVPWDHTSREWPR